jgi:nucleoid DNA-binding protein
MDELVKLVAKKANISADQAKQAIETVMKFLNGKLPEPVMSQIKGLLAGDTSQAGDKVGDAVKGLGSLFGKK